jgi:hypothetical protein
VPPPEPSRDNKPISLVDRLPTTPREPAEHFLRPAAPPEGAVEETSPSWRRAPHGENVVPFRRRRAVRRLRRHPLVRWLYPFLQAVALVALPVLLVGWFVESPRFAFQESRITTGERVPTAWVESRLWTFEGRNLLLLPLDEVEAALGDHPWVERVALRKELPSRLHVEVKERQEVALLRGEKGFVYLDSKGREIAPFEPGDKEVDLVLVSRRSPQIDPAPALELLAELEGSGIPWYRGLSEIDILGRQDFKIFTTDLPFPLLVRGGTVEHKARRLKMLLPQIVERYGSGSQVDLRFARRIIVQPGHREGGATASALRDGVS